MSTRSRREHKPTSKFLNYYTRELSTPNNEGQKSKGKQPLVKSATTTNAARRKSSLGNKRKLVKDEVEIMVESDTASPSTVTLNSSDIRRSSRQHKPNQKLKEFLQPSVDEYGTTTTLETPSNKNVLKKSSASVARKNSAKKSVAAVSPMIRKEGIKTPIRCPKHITVGLVDCFEGLANDLARTHPVTANPEATDNSDNEAVVENVTRKRGTKRPLDEGSDSNSEPPVKNQRLEPSVIRNMTKTKKSTKMITVVETVDLDSNRKKKTVTQNSKSKVTKQYPLRKPPSSALLSEMEDERTVSDVASSSPTILSSPDSPANHVTRQQQRSTQPALRQPQKKQTQQSQPQQKDIRETLKKFLIMGTKVANAISETLKHNEEALLSKSSAFERKCLNLVHALARQGADLEEDDMEKVIKLLDEEQEERKIYRHTFLESLRVSHLTNMALYSQMLRLLKTL